MFINEVIAGSAVKLVVNDEKKKIVLESEVLEDIVFEEHKLAVKAFKYKDTLIRFDYGKIKAYIDNYSDGKSYIFPISCIYADKENSSETYHVLCSDHDAQFINKRGAIRVPLSSPVKVFRTGSQMMARAKDLSCTGISFYTSKDDGFAVGEEVVCEFEELFIKCKVSCVVVRLIQQGEDKIIAGCKIKGSTSKALGELVNGIQLQHRRNFRKNRK